MDIVSTTAAVVTLLAPFTPFLLKLGKTGAEKLAEVIGEKGGEAAWQKAQSVWAKIKLRFGDDPEVQSAATMVALKPEDEARQKTLAEVLGARITAEPALANELVALLGGPDAVQQIIAERGSWIEDVKQSITGAGSQTVRASDNSTITSATQNIQR